MLVHAAQLVAAQSARRTEVHCACGLRFAHTLCSLHLLWTGLRFLLSWTARRGSETVAQRWNRLRLVSISALWYHSYSPPTVSNGPSCSERSFNVNCGPSSCSLARTGPSVFFLPSSKMYRW